MGETTTTPAPDRNRKVSLTARLGKAFGNPSGQTQTGTSSHSPGGSPSSPSSTSKFKSSFTKAFRRTSAEPAQSDTRTDSPDAPPVPPKDEQSPRQAQPSTNGHVAPSAPGAKRTPSGGVGFSQSSVLPSPRSDSLPSNPQPLRTNGTFTPGSASVNHSNAATINHASPQDLHLSPSPSAQRVFSEARIKSLTQEEEIQARFRRDLYVNDSGPSSHDAGVVAGGGTMDSTDDQEEDLRLPYDMSDDGHSDHITDKEQNTTGDDIPQALQLGKPVGTRTEDGRVLYSEENQPRQDTGDVMESDVLDTEEEARRAENEINLEDDRVGKKQEHESGGLELAQREAEESREREMEEARLAEEQKNVRLREEEEHRARLAEEKERQRLEEEDRIRSQAAEDERMRLLQEEERLRMQAIEDERNRLAEEERLAKEAEAKRVQEEEDARQKEEEEEKQRIAQKEQRLIEEARLREEEETLRIALEEQKRIEEARLREEEIRRKEEEERRIEAEKQEAERARKEGIKQSLREGKANGGVMLRGVGHILVLSFVR